MKGKNQVILLGNVGAGVTYNSTVKEDTGEIIRYAYFSLATDESYYRMEKGEQVLQTATEWHKIVAFGNLAEICQKYVTKGSRLLVQGKLRTKKIIRKSDNVEIPVTEILASEIILNDRLDKVTEDKIAEVHTETVEQPVVIEEPKAETIAEKKQQETLKSDEYYRQEAEYNLEQSRKNSKKCYMEMTENERIMFDFLHGEDIKKHVENPKKKEYKRSIKMLKTMWHS